MVITVTSKNEIKKFIYFIKDLYHNEKNFIYPFFNSQKKELYHYVLKSKQYKALYVEENHKIVARILYTFVYNPKRKEKMCYFSFFDAYNHIQAVKELFDVILTDMKENNISYIEGPYCPYDPETRRGILTNHYESISSMFLSYNYSYYSTLLNEIGFKKAFDTYTIKKEIDDKAIAISHKFALYSRRRLKVHYDIFKFKNIDKDLQDIHEILNHATTEINYQEAPSLEIIQTFVKKLKFLIKPEYAVIARENETNRPVGFIFVIPDYAEVFLKMKGHLNPIKLLLSKNKITKVRGWLQYVIPEYQGSSLIGGLFDCVISQFKENNIVLFEGGTIMEENRLSLTVFDHYGGEKYKIYRIFGKEV